MVSNTSRNGGAVMIGLNRRRTMGNALPYDAEIEYLESSGTQYINTGILPNNITINAEFLQTKYVNEISFFGCWVLNTKIVHFTLYNNKIYYSCGSSTETNTSIPKNFINNWNIITISDSGFLKLNNTIISNNTITQRTANCNLLLFARYSSRLESAGAFSKKTRCRRFEIKNNLQETVLELIPVRVGQVGYMYDKVSGKLFGNSGTGNFILGNDVN